MNTRYLQSLINTELWEKAKWKGIMYYMIGNVPGLIFVFKNARLGSKIFGELKERVGDEDFFEELRMSFVTGDLPGEKKGYSVIISSNPLNIVNRVKTEEGEEINPNLVAEGSAICRIRAPGGSKDVEDFVQRFNEAKEYEIEPMSYVSKREKLLKDFLPKDLSIRKRELNVISADELDEKHPEYKVLIGGKKKG